MSISPFDIKCAVVAVAGIVLLGLGFILGPEPVHQRLLCRWGNSTMDFEGTNLKQLEDRKYSIVVGDQTVIVVPPLEAACVIAPKIKTADSAPKARDIET